MVKRYASIDIFRGFSIALVINSHIFFGLSSNGFSLSLTMEDPLILWFAFFANIGQLFFFVSGCSNVVAIEKNTDFEKRKNKIVVENARRGVIILLIGVVFDPIIYFHFGHVDTLQLIGLADIVVPIVYLKFANRENRSKVMLLMFVFFIIMSPIARILIGYPVIDPNAENLVYYESPESIVGYVQAWFTTSFFPIFPYLGFFFLGAWFATRIKSSESRGTERKVMKRCFGIGVVCFIIGLVMVLTPYFFFEDLLDAPQWEQSWWVVELCFNVQPMTTSSIFIYTGFILASLSFIYYVFDAPHSDISTIKLGRAYQRSHLSPVFNTFVRYSYLSFTIYILQYLWIPILRVLEILIGVHLLYSIGNEYILLVICIAANTFFAFFARWMMKKKRRMKMTVENLVRVFSKS